MEKNSEEYQKMFYKTIKTNNWIGIKDDMRMERIDKTSLEID